ncbi:MAG: hypothetical protein IPL22_21545 [Bacteroidetes bacterium]|nr:hypothetical protein [Bacteroidota bacterium]
MKDQKFKIYLLLIAILSITTTIKGQSVGLSFVYKLSTDRDLKYTPCMGFYVMDDFSEKWDGFATFISGKSTFEDSKTDYSITYKRTTIKVDLNYILNQREKNRTKLGLSLGWCRDNFTQSGIVSNWTSTFTNFGLGIGLPLSFQSKGILNSPLQFNFSFTPTYLHILKSKGIENTNYMGNRKDALYVDVSVGIAFMLK